MKDHEIAALVNTLRDIAIKYHGSQQLREQIAAVVVPALRGARNATNTESQVTALKAYRDEMRDACSHFQDTSDVEERLTAILESVSPHPPRTLPDDECEAIGSVTAALQQRVEPEGAAADFVGWLGPRGIFMEDEIYQAWKEYRKDPSAAQYRKVYAAPPIQRQDPSPVPHVDPDWLANFIRTVDGGHTMGAGALAEKIAEAINGRTP